MNYTGLAQQRDMRGGDGYLSVLAATVRRVRNDASLQTHATLAEEHRLDKPGVGGANPSPRTTLTKTPSEEGKHG